MGGYWTSGVGAAFGRIVTGTKTVTTSGSAVQVTTVSTPIAGVWLSGDTEGSGGVIVVGDSSVNAIEGSQQGITIVPGNPSIFLPISNLNLLWVDSASDSGKLCYAYLQPTA